MSTQVVCPACKFTGVAEELLKEHGDYKHCPECHTALNNRYITPDTQCIRFLKDTKSSTCDTVFPAGQVCRLSKQHEQCSKYKDMYFIRSTELFLTCNIGILKKQEGEYFEVFDMTDYYLEPRIEDAATSKTKGGYVRLERSLTPSIFEIDPLAINPKCDNMKSEDVAVVDGGNYGCDCNVESAKNEEADTVETDNKIKCEHCGTEISIDILMKKQGHINTCPVCNEFYKDSIVCDDCGTSFNTKVLFEKNGCTECLVCGKKFELGLPVKEDELKTWYCYDNGKVICTTLFEDETPTQTFKAKDLSDAEEKLKEFKPDAFQSSTPSQVKCPHCGSTQIQLVPRKWSLLMGIMTNKVDRTCLNCQRTF